MHRRASVLETAEGGFSTRFVLFEVGRANVGDARKRPTAAHLIAGWNALLKADGVRLTGSVAHTGNYIAETTSDLASSDLTDIFLRLKVRMAVFPEVEFREDHFAFDHVNK